MSRYASLEAKVELQTEKFHKALTKLVSMLQGGAKEAVIEGSRLFAAAARKAMPPSPGKSKIGRDKMRRPIIPLSADEKGFMRKLYYHDKIRYRVPWIKTLDHGKFRGVREFETLTAAKEFAMIRYRGAARLGWGQALRALGDKLPNQYPAGFPASSVARLTAVTGSTTINDRPDGGFSVEIENHSRAAGDYWLLKAEGDGRRKAALAINRKIRKIEKETANL